MENFQRLNKVCHLKESFHQKKKNIKNNFQYLKERNLKKKADLARIIIAVMDFSDVTARSDINQSLVHKTIVILEHCLEA